MNHFLEYWLLRHSFHLGNQSMKPLYMYSWRVNLPAPTERIGKEIGSGWEWQKASLEKGRKEALQRKLISHRQNRKKKKKKKERRKRPRSGEKRQGIAREKTKEKWRTNGAANLVYTSRRNNDERLFSFSHRKNEMGKVGASLIGKERNPKLCGKNCQTRRVAPFPWQQSEVLPSFPGQPPFLWQQSTTWQRMLLWQPTFPWQPPFL